MSTLVNSYCIIIPIYNNHQTIADVVESVMYCNLPIIIVDDGSNEETQDVLQVIKQKYSQLSLYTLEQNSGKGAAVIRGIQEAKGLGFTHVVQIDADGQHNVNDIPHFISASESHPRNLILGHPVFDDNIPSARRWGRKVSQFWVWVETLSFQIIDPLCGFRLYPVDGFLQTIQGKRIGFRMDFDLEILTRFKWSGGNIINVRTRVVYPEGGISHFKMLEDNIAISWLHTRMTTRMIFTFPIILWKRWF